MLQRSHFSWIAILGVAIAWFSLPAAAQELVQMGPGPLIRPPGDCITPAEREIARQAIARYEAGRTAAGRFGLVPGSMTFEPIAGTNFKDRCDGYSVDLDPTPGIRDFNCSAFTYDGHGGNDFGLGSSWEIKDIGVPVYAALDGVVVDSHDGEFDEVVTPTGAEAANYVILDHGGDLYGYYWHFKKGSVAVQPGESVTAGTQIGCAASSGYSSGSHLHLEMATPWTAPEWESYEPFAGPCRPGQSAWLRQAPVPTEARLWDFYLTDATEFPDWFRIPRTGTVTLGPGKVGFFAWLMFLPSQSTWGVVFERPDGTEAFRREDSFGNAEPYGESLWYWTYNVTADEAGTWHIRLEVNGELLARAPAEVVAAGTTVPNRPPLPADGAAFEPDPPLDGAPLLCRLDAPTVLNDPDYDIVRYRYRWTVNGQPVRDVTIAATSDVLRRDLFSAKDAVRCEVTVSDGKAEANTVAAEAVVQTQGCELTCSAGTSADHGVSPLLVDFTSEVVPTGCHGTISYDWDFGDGTRSGEPNPTHGFTGGGEFPWRLTVASDLATCTRTGIVSLQPACAYSLPPAAKSFPVKGGSATVTVKAAGTTSCQEPPVRPDAWWVTGTLAKWKNNKGTVRLQVAANASSAPRAAVVDIGWEPLAVTQAGAPCKVASLSPKSAALPAAGGEGSFAVNAPQDCGWTVTQDGASSAWLTLGTSGSSGPGTVSYSAPANGSGKIRKATLTVSGASGSKRFALVQAQ